MACYSEDIFDNPDDLLESFMCPIGLGVLRDPVTDPCGHTFCRICIEKSLEENSTCPFSKSPLSSDQLDPNENIAGFIDQFNCKCENHEGGCKWTGIIKEVQAHSEECEFQEMPCTFNRCKESVMRREFENHKNTCIYRPIACPYCSTTIQSCDANGHNLNNCLEFEHKCRIGCEEMVKRRFFDFHKVYICSKVKRVPRVDFKDARDFVFSDFF